ncbi:MAG: DNA mismatch repair endonuclease MutL [Candidatus Anammoximicrobium sp.]|nr:DNA mismatch repair endonuclease MutL [Candidatus Anammoximicrobium sp.]
MTDIRLLSPSIINKIAAGEVIERPASVVKELMENSVDAGARRIDVAVEKGGSELVRVADDGGGIKPDQLPLAVASHATSKIASADDLFDVRTLGFRGEALASIAEISQLLLRSRHRDEPAGYQLEVRGGQAGEVTPCGCPVGTVLEVRQLFFNTPVRRKFLRATQTEMGHVTEAFIRIALVHPQVHFTLQHNDRSVYDLPAVDSWRERIVTFFGGEIGQSLIPVASDDGQIRWTGYVADPNYSRANNRMQYFFLNGRHIRDRSLQHALGEAYRGLLTSGRYPIAFFRLEMPADLVDVNVHPTKLEVRFQDGGRIYSQLLSALRQKFLGTDLTARVKPTPLPADADPAGALDPARSAQHRDELVQWAQGQLQGKPAPAGPAIQDAGSRAEPWHPAGAPSPATATRLPLDFDRAAGRAPPFRPFPDGGFAARGTPAAAPQPELGPAERGEPAHGEAGPPARPPAAHLHAAFQPAAGLQVHNRYLITENEDGVVIIDQHALHERILYEQLREKIQAGALEKQRLLVPEPVSMPPAEAAAALEAKEILAQLGIEIEPFGGDTILVSTYPAMLANFDPHEILRQIVEQLMTGGSVPERRDLLDEMLHMISCKAAIKAGDRLTPDEIASLLQQRHHYRDTHHCPHGRPTALVFTREELDKRFKRT